MDEPIVGLSLIVIAGVGAQWLGSRLKVPSILFLLASGLLLGPVTSIIKPDELLGDLLFPLVSLGVGLLLFEGGLNLRADRITAVQTVVLRLVSVGVIATLVVGFAALMLLFDITRGEAMLTAAVLTVSGPTVVMPLLRLARLREPLGAILRWEGIFIDPIGALLAVVVLEAIIGGHGLVDSAWRIGTTAIVGSFAGGLVAILLLWVLSRHWVPDHLQNPVVLMALLIAFAGSEAVAPEAGLFASTILGVVVANQHVVAIRHIHEFEENLGQLVLGALFIILAARVDLDAVWAIMPQSLVFVAVLVFVARPMCVVASTIGTGVSASSRNYLMCLAPRGIVAAAVASLFELELVEHDRQAPFLVPIVFTTIIVTVLIYGVAASPLAKRLRVARPPAHGVAFVGAPKWARQLAAQLIDRDVPVLLIATQPHEVDAATREGLLVFNGRMDSEDLALGLESVGVEKAIALSGAAELDAFGVTRLVEELGRANVYHLPPSGDHSALGGAHVAAVGRRPFGPEVTQMAMDELLASGGEVEVFSAADLVDDAEARLLPLGHIARGRFTVANGWRPPRDGELLVAITNGNAPE